MLTQAALQKMKMGLGQMVSLKMNLRRTIQQSSFSDFYHRTIGAETGDLIWTGPSRLCADLLPETWRAQRGALDVYPRGLDSSRHLPPC